MMSFFMESSGPVVRHPWTRVQTGSASQKPELVVAVEKSFRFNDLEADRRRGVEPKEKEVC